MVKLTQTCMKYLLFLFNLVFVVGGIFLIAIGVIAKLKGITLFGDTNSVSLPIVIISIGIFTFLLAFLGCCGAIKENVCKLTLFGILLLALLICQIAGIILATTNHETTEATIKNNMNITLKKQEAAAVKAWDAMQAGFHCCGVEGPQDYLDNDLRIPQSCCGHDDEEKCSKDKAAKDGCYARLVEFVKKNLKIFGAAGGILAAVELVGAIFAFCLVSGIRESTRPRSPRSSSPGSYSRY